MKKENMKKYQRLFLTFCLAFVMMLAMKVDVAAVEYNSDGENAIFVGNNLYYQDGYGEKIKCYNIKRGKTSTIASVDGNGFHSLTKKGGYIYAVCDLYEGSDAEEEYIVRVNIKTGKIQYLSRGDSYAIKNNTIYFNKVKHIEARYEEYDKGIGVYSMKLDGTGQKSCSGVKVKYKPKNKIKTSKGTLNITRDSYGYISKLVFKSKNGKSKTIAKTKEYGGIFYCNAKGDYIVYKIIDGWHYTTKLVKTNGKTVKTLVKVEAAGT